MNDPKSEEKNTCRGTSLVVQWLGCLASNAGGGGLNFHQGIHAMWPNK